MPWALPRHNINFSLKDYLHIVKSIFTKPTSEKFVRKFESEFAEYLGCQYCYTFSSGSAALYHGIIASGLKKGDKIIFPKYEFHSLIQTMGLWGVKPVFADIDPGTGNITPETASEVLEKHKDAKAILVANIHGRPADLTEMAALCKDKNLLLIEDCAHSAGSSVNGKKTGNFGDFSYFSFGPGKSLAACGGGALATNNPAIAKSISGKLHDLRPPCQKEQIKAFISSLVKGLLSTKPIFTLILFPVLYLVGFLGKEEILDKALASEAVAFDKVPDSYNRKFSDSMAALALSQLAKLDLLNQKREKNAFELEEGLLGVEKIRLPSPPPENMKRATLNFKVEVNNGADFSKSLFRSGIDTRRDYLSIFSDLHPFGQKPANSVYLPNHAGITSKDIKRIVAVVRRYVKD